MTGWRFLASSPWDYGQVSVGGLNVWDWEWRSTGESVKLPDPHYGNMRSPAVYVIGPDDAPVRFAADEVANGIVCFWIPEEQPVSEI